MPSTWRHPTRTGVFVQRPRHRALGTPLYAGVISPRGAPSLIHPLLKGPPKLPHGPGAREQSLRVQGGGASSRTPLPVGRVGAGHPYRWVHVPQPHQGGHGDKGQPVVTWGLMANPRRTTGHEVAWMAVMRRTVAKHPHPKRPVHWAPLSPGASPRGPKGTWAQLQSTDPACRYHPSHAKTTAGTAGWHLDLR